MSGAQRIDLLDKRVDMQPTRLAFANFTQVTNRAQAEHGARFHLTLSFRLHQGYPRLAIVHAKIAECFEARVLDLCREGRDK